MQTIPLLLARVRGVFADHGFSRKTENAYLNHIRRFAEYFQGRDFGALKTDEINEFIDDLGVSAHYSNATRNQAASAISFLYREVFGANRQQMPCVKRTERTEKTPVVLTADEAARVLAQLQGAAYLVAALIYGSGLRLSEAIALRVGDVDFTRREINVRDARTGAKRRTTFLPASIVAPLERHLGRVLYLFEDDCLLGCGGTNVPKAVLRKTPEAETVWRWQFLFPACKLSGANGDLRRLHIAESTVQKAIGEAVRLAKIEKNANSQTLRHSFAVRLFENHGDAQRIRNLLGQKNLCAKFTKSRTPVFISPLDG